MPPEETIIDGPGHPGRNGCEAVLRSLPDWFGIEDALLGFAADAEVLPTFAARRADRLIGFLTVKRHFPSSAEIHVVAVHKDHHRRGIGRRLLAATENWLRREGVRLLGVKTISESCTDPFYARTRQFYLDQGFEPFEEMPRFWNEANPCLLMVKHLGVTAA